MHGELQRLHIASIAVQDGELVCIHVLGPWVVGTTKAILCVTCRRGQPAMRDWDTRMARHLVFSGLC